MTALTVLAPGPLTTVQDLGRPGRGAEGIGRSGVCDRASAALANRLVGNPADAALLEVTAGGLVLQVTGGFPVRGTGRSSPGPTAPAVLGDPAPGAWLALTGARCPGAPYAAPFWWPAGRELRLGPPVGGMRTYLAVRGGIAVDPVLGSRSTDLLSGLGPPAVQAGDVLPVGAAGGPLPGVDVAPVAQPSSGEVVVPVVPGPRADWFGADAHALLTGSAWTVTGESNRVGLRLDGPSLPRTRSGELVSEGMVRGALQVPPSGRPVLFLADHPVTGGYPVIGYVAEPDVDRCGQLAPGQTLRFRSR